MNWLTRLFARRPHTTAWESLPDKPQPEDYIPISRFRYDVNGTTEPELPSSVAVPTRQEPAAMSELPTYVLKIAPNGSRVFKEEFIVRLGHDLLNGKTTVPKASGEFNISASTLHKWKRYARVGKTPRSGFGRIPGSHNSKEAIAKMAASRRARFAKANSHDLLSQAMNYQESSGDTDAGDRWEIDAHHVRLALAYCSGKITRNAVNHVLRSIAGKPQKIITTTWLGACLRWAIANGYELKKGAKS